MAQQHSRMLADAVLGRQFQRQATLLKMLPHKMLIADAMGAATSLKIALRASKHRTKLQYNQESYHFGTGLIHGWQINTQCKGEMRPHSNAIQRQTDREELRGRQI